MSALMRLAAGGRVPPVTYVDDVFSAYTYTGNGSTQTITNGIDLASKGGLVWVKNRGSTSSHQIWDSVRGGANFLHSELINAQNNVGGTPYTLNSNGYTLNSEITINQSSQNFVSWTFRKAPKFFDVVTWTGNSVSGRAIPHSLGVAPGFIMVKCTSNTYGWICMHRSLNTAGNEYLVLNTTAAKTSFASAWGSAAPTATEFYVSSFGENNTTGATYVAYLFAHDTGTDGIVQCGSFTTDGSGNATVNLGWEPQYVMIKQTNAANNWQIFDTSRAFTATDGTAKELDANLNSTEYTYPTGTFKPTATGFQAPVGFLSATATYIYLAIRRPNKPPTVGTQVYQAIARTGTGAAATVTGVGFAPDLARFSRKASAQGTTVDRLRGNLARILTTTTAAETTSFSDVVTGFGMDGISVGADASISAVNGNTLTYINWFFKRAPGVFDVVCWTGDNTTNRSIPHQLSASPELVIWKNRTSTLNWAAYSSSLLTTDRLYLNLADAVLSTSALLTSVSSSDIVAASASGYVNASGSTYVAYLFATKAGISKCGSYTGNGSSLTLNMGFTTGARFFMVKRTDSTGDWYVWDTTRGIIAGNDGHLSLNTTAAEVTTNDSVDPDVTGLIVNQVAATNINVTSATYIYLSFS